jgi:hypothetical protein
MEVPEVFRKVCEKNGWPCQKDQVELVLAGGRKQKVFVETFVHENEQMARAYSVVGTTDALSEVRLKSALSLNYRLPHGALAIRDDALVMTDTFLLKEADDDEVEASVRYLAKTADRYEKAIYGADQH